MRISRRKVLLIAGGALLALSALLALLLLLITSSPFQQWLLRRAESFAADAGFPFTAKSLRLDLTDLTGSLDGLAYDQNGQQIHVDHLHIDIPWNALRGEGVRITSIEADGVSVNIRSTETSSGGAVVASNSTTTAARATTTKPPRIQIDRIAIRNASVTYSTPTSVVKAPSVSIEATNGRGLIRLDAPASVGPMTDITVGQVPFVLDPDSVRFGPAAWAIRYAKYDGSGSAQGVVRWSPALTVEAEVATDPLTIEKWQGIRMNAKASYANGSLDVSEFRGTQGNGEFAGSIQISDAGTSANTTWKNLRLDPSGFVARTSGGLNLKWKQPDFSDLSGSGKIQIDSRQYGVLHTDLRISNAKATIDARANSMDLAITAKIATSLEPLLVRHLNEFRGTIEGRIQPLPTSSLYQRLDPVNVSATAVFRDNDLTIRGIDAKSKGYSVSGAALRANLTNRRIRGAVPSALIDLHDFVPEGMGIVSLSADIAGSFDQPTASFTVFSTGLDFGSTHIDNVKLNGEYANAFRGMVSGTIHAFPRETPYTGLSAINVSAAATFHDNVLTVQDAHAESGASHLSDASLEVNLTDKQIRGKATTVQIDLSDFGSETNGTVNLTADIGGTIDQPAASFTGSSTGLEIGGTHIDTVGLEGKFENDTLVVTRFEARQSDGILNATGHVNLATEAIDAEAQISDLKVVQVADLSTTASVKAQVAGTYRSPRVDFSGELRDIIYREEEHGTVRLEGTTNLKTATVRANSDKYSARVTGEVTLEAPYVFTAALTSTQSRIHYGKYNFIADGRVRASGEAQPFKASNFEFDTFKLRGEGIALSADGSLNTGAVVDLKVDLAELPVEGVDLDGTAHVAATVSGNPTDPSIEGALTTDNASVRIMQMSKPAAVSGHVDFTGRDFTIRGLEATYAEATATITGTGSWQGTGQLQFRIANVRPENFVPGRPVSGIASAEGELDFKGPRLEDLSGRVRVTQLDMTVRDAAVHQTQPIEADLADQVLTVRNFEIEGLDTHARITGQASLLDRTVNFDADADTDLAILEPFIPNSHPSGRIETRVALRGTIDNPSLDGFLNVLGGELAIERPDFLLSKVDVEAQLRGERIELTRASGTLNGGTFEASGGAGLSAAGLKDAAFKVNVQRGQLEYPEGLQSEFSTQLTLDGTMPNLTLRGNVDVLNAIYQKDLNLTQAVFARITSTAPAADAAVTEGASNQIRMEVEVRTPGAIVIKNNVADLEAAGTFQIRGTVANPIILGRALVEEGGELYFGPAVSSQSIDRTQRSDRYTIERGSIDFNNPLRIEPELDFRATHELEVQDERYLITLEVTGTPETLKAELTSDPHLEQSDIVAMLLTGRTLQELQGQYATAAGEQALNYMSGQLSARVLSQAGNVVGLNTVRIDPVTVANQTDVAARLTIAKDITREFTLIYSQDLNDASAQTWIASYQPFKKFVLRGINDGDANEITLDLKHELRLGGGAPFLERTQPANEARLRRVTFTGSQFVDKDLRKHVTKEGNPFGRYRVSQDVRNLRGFMASQGYPNARIQAQQVMEERDVDVQFDIVTGAKIVLAYEGADVPKNLQAEIQQIWTLRSSDAVSLRESSRRLLRHFRSEGYLQARVSVGDPSSDANNDRRYIFKIEPSHRFDKPTWVFNGIEPMDIHDPAGLVMESPEAIKERIESNFRSNGYLDVKSTIPNLVIEGTKAHFEVTVDQGMTYTVESIEFEGNRAIDAERLRGIVTAEGSKQEATPLRFTSEWLEGARRNITSEYWKRGYNDVQIVPSTTSDSKLAQSNVRFAILEGEPQIIEAIEITGVATTSRSYIEHQFEFKKGDPVDLTKVNLTRKNLYDTRLFKRVEIVMVPGTNGYTAKIQLTENAPWQLRYGVAVTEHLDDGNRSVGLAADLSYNNLFGRAITAGVSGKLNSDEKDARAFASMPQLFGRKVTTSLTLFRTLDQSDPKDVVDYWGTTAQQQWRLGNHYLLSYDYSYRQVLKGERNLLREEDSILDDPRVPLARFNGTISRDTRDDLLNATRGTFLSNSFEIAPPGIGSSIQFLRNYSQAFRFQPLKKFVLASAIRFGVAKPLGGDELDSTLQFLAGGGTTVRAFKQDELTQEPGNYELILNQEFRFPLFWKFSGVTFMDAGQVALRSENVFNFRWGPGVGIRIQTPFVLLRTDLGININRRPGEDRGRWSFGIGQAF